MKFGQTDVYSLSIAAKNIIKCKTIETVKTLVPKRLEGVL